MRLPDIRSGEVLSMVYGGFFLSWTAKTCSVVRLLVVIKLSVYLTTLYKSSPDKIAQPMFAEYKIPFLSIGPVHFRFKSCWVVLF